MCYDGLFYLKVLENDGKFLNSFWKREAPFSTYRLYPSIRTPEEVNQSHIKRLGRFSQLPIIYSNCFEIFLQIFLGIILIGAPMLWSWCIFVTQTKAHTNLSCILFSPSSVTSAFGCTFHQWSQQYCVSQLGKPPNTPIYYLQLNNFHLAQCHVQGSQITLIDVFASLA